MPTKQDDFDRLMRILSDAPSGGLSIDEIQKVTHSGESWSYRTINELLCGLGAQVAHAKVRVGHSKVTKYWMKELL